jgi:hypothetical protein
MPKLWADSAFYDNAMPQLLGENPENRMLQKMRGAASWEKFLQNLRGGA